jgi:signal transduction histidine kinase/CheY-like chemotaxis protein/PAS domain-containing protein
VSVFDIIFKPAILIGFILLVTLFAVIVIIFLRIYRERNRVEEELRKRENLLIMLNNAANILLSVNDEASFETLLIKSFELVGNCLNVDRVQIWRNEMINGELNFVHCYEWLSEYCENHVTFPKDLPFSYRIKPEWKNLFFHGGYINAPVSGLPEDDKAFLASYGMKSIVIIPIFLERHTDDDRRNTKTDRRQEKPDRRQIHDRRQHNEQYINDRRHATVDRRQSKIDRRQAIFDRRERTAADRRQLADVRNNFWGLLCIDDCRRERTFSEDEIRILTSVGLMMGSTIIKNLQNTKLREADERTQVMLDATPLAANFFDGNFRHIDCNQEAVKMYELSSKKEYSERYFELSPEYQPDGKSSAEKFFELIKKTFNEGYCKFEWMHQKLNGEPIPCEVTLVRVKYKNNFIVAGYTRDLRELKTTIAQMNESKQTLSIMENILNGIDASIYVTIPDTCEILFINDYMKKMFKIESDCIGQFCYKLFVNSDKKCDFCPCYKLDNEPESTIVWERLNEVSERTLRCMDRYIEWYDGRIVHIHNSFDVTELIAAKEQAEQSSRFKTQFLSRMSHEVRTPMNAILGITEIHLQDETLPVDMQKILGEINNSGYLLLNIINDILDLSKIEAGKLELSPVIYDISNMIINTVHLNTVLYNYKQIKFNLYVDENIPSTLFGDELRIKQILNNLLSNAFKYTDEGEISLSVTSEFQKDEASGVTIIFRVADTGQGMTSEQLDKLFDEFTRFNIQTNRTVEGTGLGMNITKHLINMMDGKIDVKSEIGRGSLFTLRLPQGIAGAGILGKETADNLKQFQTGSLSQIKKPPQIIREYMPYGKVLIVDDIETNLYVARGLLAPYGLSLDTVVSGFAAIEKIKKGDTFDIIFLDHFMPKLDGMETAAILRKMGYTHPIIALTANALAGQAEIFLSNGFDGFISKPIDTRQLNTILNKYIRDKYPTEVLEAARLQAAAIQKKAAAEVQPLSDPELKALFVRDAENAFTRINAIYSNLFRRGDDIRQYVVDVHSMKSALLSVGEYQASSIALKLEQAGRAKDIASLVSETPAFLEALRAAIEKNKADKEGTPEYEYSENDRAYLSEKLFAIQTACGQYDEKTANLTLTELIHKNWPPPVKEQLDAVSVHLLHSEFEKAAKIVDNFLREFPLKS